MYKCKICKKRFKLLPVYRYVARDEKHTGITAALQSTEVKLYDAFDCPHCGCQNIVNERKITQQEPKIVMVKEERSEEYELEED